MKEGLGITVYRTLKTKGKARPRNGITNTMGGEVMGHYKRTVESGLWTLDWTEIYEIVLVQLFVSFGKKTMVTNTIM